MTMKFLIAILMLSAPSAAIMYWISGLCGGFRLSSKLPPKVKRALRVYGMLTMLSGGAAVGVAGARGCISMGGLAAYAASAAAAAEAPAIQTRLKTNPGVKDFHSLGTLAAPSPQLLRRLREEDAHGSKRQEAQKQMVQLSGTFISGNIVISGNSWRISGNAISANTLNSTAGNVEVTIPAGFSVSTLANIKRRGTRKGPFCRITCTVHHNDHYDVEVEKKFCETQSVPAGALEVWGWAPLNDKEEYFNPWPGPAVAGFHTYKLYWTEKTQK